MFNNLSCWTREVIVSRRSVRLLFASRLGFTLIELMVVIAIVAVLSVVGIVVFNNVQKSARDSANIANVNAIAKAYETKYLNTGSYLTGSSPTIDSSYFAGGVVPTPSGSNYLIIKNDSSGGLKTCSPVNGNTQTCSDTSSTCFCKGVSQATPPDQTSTNSYYSLIADGTVTTTTAPQASPVPTPTPVPSPIPSPVPSPSPSPSPAPVCPASGLAGYWNFNAGSGTTLTDNSGNGKNGTWSGTGAHWTTGKFGGGGSFNGSNDSVNLGSFDTAANIKTIAFWAKFNSLTDGQEIISKSAGCAGVEVLLYGGGLGMYVMNTGCNPAGAATIPYSQFNTTSYHFFTATQDGSQLRLYLNGVLKTTASSPSTIANPQNLLFGAWNSGGRMFNGNLDEVRIYNRAISATEVTTLYGAGLGCAP